MNVENPIAFSFILQDDIYLLEADKTSYTAPAPIVATNTIAEPEPLYAVTPGAEIVAEKQELVAFKFMGGNKKHYIILTYYPNAEFIDDGHLAALQSTLGRLNTSADDVAIVNLANYPDTSVELLRTFFNPQKLLFLGKDSVPARAVNIPLNKISHVEGIATLLTFSFDEMMNSVDHKKAFWEQMKQF
jgi:hypothetical protein